jgi:hypothetical protein
MYVYIYIYIGSYIYDGLLPLDSCLQALPLDVDDEVPALVVSGQSRYGDVEVGDGLLPLVGKGILLGLLPGAGGCLLGGGGFCRDGGLVEAVKDV